MIRKIFFILISYFFTQTSSAQTSEILERYIDEGLKNNASLHQENLEFKKSLEVVKQARALFYPQVSFNPTYSYAVGGRKINFPVGDLLNPVYKSLNDLLAKQQFQPNIENVDFLLAPTNFHDTKFNVQYAIYNPEIKYNYLIQKNLLSAQEAKVNIIQNELRFAIQIAYLQYLQSHEVTNIYVNAIEVLQANLRLNKNLVANQKATKDVIYSSEFELSKVLLQQTESIKTTKVAKAFFNFLLNKNLDAEIEIDTMLVKHQYDIVKDPLDKYVNQALQKRSELKQFDFMIKASEQNLRLHQTAAFMPKVFVGGNMGFQGYGYVFKNQGYLIGQAGLQWDLFKGYERKSKMSQAKIQLDLVNSKKSDTEKQIELQTIQAYQDWASTQDELDVTRAGLNSVKAFFKIVDSRYKNGGALQIEHVKAHNDVVSANIQNVISQFNVLIKKAVLDRVTAKMYN